MSPLAKDRECHKDKEERDFSMVPKGIKKIVMECRMDNSCSSFLLSIYLLSSFNNLFIFGGGGRGWRQQEKDLSHGDWH